jgi:hypothetical protein
MQTDFLSFKGVKHYSPEQGWQQLSDALHYLQERSAPSQDQLQFIPVLQDALIKVDHYSPQDAMGDEWHTVAGQVSQLTDCMNAQRLYREKLLSLDKNIEQLRESIKQNLDQMSKKMVSQP